MSKKTNFLKIILDIVMLVVLILMYDKLVLGLPFHEIGGLILCVAFVVHCLLNKSWIIAATKGIFGKHCSGTVRAKYIVDVLLLISMLVILISGLLISKIITPFWAVSGVAFKVIHFSASALALVLLGIHIAMHWTWLVNTIQRIFKISIHRNFVRILSAFFILAGLVFGSYSLVNSNFTRWLTSPVVAVTEHVIENGEEHEGEGAGQGLGLGPRNGQGRGKGGGQGGLHAINTEISAGRVLSVLARFTAITALFGIIYHFISRFFRRKK